MCISPLISQQSQQLQNKGENKKENKTLIFFPIKKKGVGV